MDFMHTHRHTHRHTHTYTFFGSIPSDKVLSIMRSSKGLNKLLYIMPLHRKYTRALTFENVYSVGEYEFNKSSSSSSPHLPSGTDF
jgi:hypothetical protein